MSERPCVRLFMSADLVGSTAYKDKDETRDESERRDPHAPKWAGVFHSFYTGFHLMFRRKVLNEQLPDVLHPTVVKTIGDEILLQTKIRNHGDAQQVVCFFAHALAEYEKKNLPSQLHLKGTAWIAGFPINNYRVDIPGIGEDFIGPSIDAGFRIAKKAAPSKMVVSVDLALLLLSGPRRLKLRFDGTEPFKGVLGGRPYPLLWFLVEGRDAALLKAEARMRHGDHDQDHLLEYCEEYVGSSNSRWLIKPYFEDDSEFHERPSWHPRALEDLQKEDDRPLDLGDGMPGPDLSK